MTNDRNTVQVKVWGDLACFSRPETKVERLSYEVMTPSAARGILDAIMWRPEMRWVIEQIEVLRPVRFVSLKRNEIQNKIAPRTVKGWMEAPESFVPQVAGAGTEDATPRATVALRDVAYVIEATPLVFNPTAEDTPRKYVEMLNRRITKGQAYHRPAFGLREFIAHFGPPDGEERPVAESRDLGLMLYDIVFGEKGNLPLFFHARLEGGVVRTNPDVCVPDPSQRKELLRCSYRR